MESGEITVHAASTSFSHCSSEVRRFEPSTPNLNSPKAIPGRNQGQSTRRILRSSGSFSAQAEMAFVSSIIALPPRAKRPGQSRLGSGESLPLERREEAPATFERPDALAWPKDGEEASPVPGAATIPRILGFQQECSFPNGSIAYAVDSRLARVELCRLNGGANF